MTLTPDELARETARLNALGGRGANITPEAVAAVNDPAVFARAVARCRARLQHDPILLRFLREMKTNARRQSITEPWMALAEQRMFAAMLLSPDVPMGIATATGQSQTREQVAVVLMGAATYSWTYEMQRLAQAAPLPAHVIGRDLLPTPTMYHTFADSMLLVSAEGDAQSFLGETPEADSMLIADALTGISVIVVANRRADAAVPPGEAQHAILQYSIPFGRRYPDDFDPEHHSFIGTVLKLLAFLNSPYTETTHVSLPRAMRRHDLKHRADDAMRTISVVQLRRKARDAVAACAAATGHTLKHKFWVQGHMRAQWYPSTQAHQVIWIAPYLKGPAGAPLLEDRVYTVRR